MLHQEKDEEIIFMKEKGIKPKREKEREKERKKERKKEQKKEKETTNENLKPS